MSKPGVIFVNPSLAQGGGKCDEVLFPFAAIMLLATILDRSGYDTTIIDGNMYPLAECIEKVRAAVNENTVFVGFSVMTSQVKWAYKVADALKKSHPALKIVWGGVHATLYPEQTIADPLIDIIAVNEACSSIAMLSEALKNGGDLSQVPGIYFRKDGKVIKNAPYMPDDITKIPQIDFSLFDAPRYARNNLLPKAYDLPLKDAVMMPIITGLGCAYKCSFCINVILNRKYRYMEAEDIVDRIEYLQKEYGANFFQLLDEDFFINKKRTMDFIELVEKRGLKFYFRPWMRVSYFRDSYISEEVAKRLEKIGMVTAVMGAECGSQAMLDKIHKQIKVEDTVNAAKTLSKTRIVPRYSMMVGLPGETKEDILATYRLALKLKDIDRRSDIPILSFAAYPGSPIYSEAVKKYDLKEPASLAEWAALDFSGFLGFYSAQGKPWIFDRKIFERMNNYYNVGFQFSPRKTLRNKVLYPMLRSLIRFRFNTGWFRFPFEEYMLGCR